jgi:hypothetical protein
VPSCEYYSHIINLLSQQLSDTTAVPLRSLLTVKAHWDKIKSTFSNKGQYMEADMLTAFTESHFPHGGDVGAFLGQLCVKCEDLVAVGVTITDKEYWSTIICSLLEDMAQFTLSLLSAACILQPSTAIDPDTLIKQISEEADRLALSCKCEGSSSGKGKQSGTQDEVMAATQGDGGKKHQKGKCHMSQLWQTWALGTQVPVAQERPI